MMYQQWLLRTLSFDPLLKQLSLVQDIEHRQKRREEEKRGKFTEMVEKSLKTLILK